MTNTITMDELHAYLGNKESGYWVAPREEPRVSTSRPELPLFLRDYNFFRTMLLASSDVASIGALLGSWGEQLKDLPCGMVLEGLLLVVPQIMKDPELQRHIQRFENDVRTMVLQYAPDLAGQW